MVSWVLEKSLPIPGNFRLFWANERGAGRNLRWIWWVVNLRCLPWGGPARRRCASGSGTRPRRDRRNFRGPFAGAGCSSCSWSLRPRTDLHPRACSSGTSDSSWRTWAEHRFFKSTTSTDCCRWFWLLSIFPLFSLATLRGCNFFTISLNCRFYDHLIELRAALKNHTSFKSAQTHTHTPHLHQGKTEPDRAF